MLSFTYQYKDKTFSATAVSRIKEDELRYKVNLPDGVLFEMSPMENFKMPVTGGPVWLQHVHDGETILAHDLVQAMGEGLEKALEANQLESVGAIRDVDPPQNVLF